MNQALIVINQAQILNKTVLWFNVDIIYVQKCLKLFALLFLICWKVSKKKKKSKAKKSKRQIVQPPSDQSDISPDDDEVEAPTEDSDISN